jgi:hypothetical protein
MKSSIGFKISSSYVAAKGIFSSSPSSSTIIAYIESHDDQRLWSNLLKSKVLNDKKIRVTFKSPSLEGNANGKSTLIKMYNDGTLELGKHLLLCMDSDFDYIIGLDDTHPKVKMYDSEYVYQTYAYSAESHYYTPQGLIPICERALCGELDIDFCFEQFTMDFSNIIHMLFCHVLFLRKSGHHQDYKKNYALLKGLIKRRFGGNVNITKIGGILSSFKDEVGNLASAIDKDGCISSSKEFGEFYQSLAAKGLVDTNTLYFLKGHDLEDIVLSPMCNSVAKRIVLHRITAIKKSNNNKENVGELIGEYRNNLSNVIHCIKNRSDFNNPFYERIFQKFNSMCAKHL